MAFQPAPADEYGLARIADALGVHLYAGVFTHDGGYRATYRGPGVEEVVGGPLPSDDPGRAWQALVHPDDRELHAAWRRAVARGESSELEYRLIGVDGVTRWVWDRVRPGEPTADGRSVEGIVVDVSVRHRLADELADAQANFERILGLTTDFPYISERLPDGHYLNHFVGPGMLALLGLDHADGELCDVWYEAILPEDVAIYDATDEALDRGEHVVAEYRVRHTDGSYRWVLDRGWPRETPDGRLIVDGTITDITALRDALESERDAQSRLADVLAAIGAVAYTRYGRDHGPITLHAGGELETLFGRPIDPVAASDAWIERLHADDRADVDAHHARLAAGQESEVTYRLRGLDGQTRWIWSRARPTGSDDDARIDGVLFDVTERQLAREVEARFAAMAETIDEAMFEYRESEPGQFELIYVSPKLAALLGGPIPDGVAPQEFWISRLHPDDIDARRAYWDRAVAGEPSSCEVRIRGLDGVERWAWTRMRPRVDAAGRRYLTGVASDVTARRNLEDALRRAGEDAERRARVDDLTGVFNRRHASELIERELARVARGAPPPGLILLDLDRFKRVNDTYGHRAGDGVLVEAARRLRACVRPYDTVARWGGEEFCVVVPEVRSEGTLRRIGESLIACIGAEPFVVEGAELEITASAGGALAGPDARDADALVSEADRALYAAKHRGRNLVRIAGDEGAEEAVPGEDPEALRLARMLALAAAVREGMPSSHHEQVGALAASIARELGLAEGDVVRCRLGGLVHDVGKLGVPDAVLGRPGPLDEDHWSAIREHPRVGAAMIAEIEELTPAVGAVLHHHERVDGAGYPAGLAGDAIPLEARIVAAADAYSAMLHRRPHAPARAPGEALEELRRCTGTQFDERVVDALQAVLAGQAAA